MSLRDVPMPAKCPACGYDLRGTPVDRCPECGAAAPEPPPPLTDDQAGALREFLRGRDVYCKHCKYNLRDLTGNRCPECGAAYYLAGGEARRDLPARPRRATETAAGCLTVLAAPSAVIVLLRGMLAGGGPRLWPAMGLALMPLAVLVVLQVLRPRVEGMGPGVRGLVAAAAVGVAVAGVVAALLVV